MKVIISLYKNIPISNRLVIFFPVQKYRLKYYSLIYFHAYIHEYTRWQHLHPCYHRFKSILVFVSVYSYQDAKSASRFLFSSILSRFHFYDFTSSLFSRPVENESLRTDREKCLLIFHQFCENRRTTLENRLLIKMTLSLKF